MKLTQLASVAVVAAVALACNARAVEVTFPLVKLAISGTASYNASSPTNNGANAMSVLTKVKVNTKSLIGLLNASPTVTNTLQDVTGTSQIPAGSYFVYDLDNENLIITNLSGYNFTLRGYDGGPDESGLGQDALDRRDHRWVASGKAENILHVVDPGLLRHDPLGGPERAVCKHGPVACAVGELKALAHAGKDDRMVPHDIAPAQRVDADLGGRARAGDPLAAVAQR